MAYLVGVTGEVHGKMHSLQVASGHSYIMCGRHHVHAIDKVSSGCRTSLVVFDRREVPYKRFKEMYNRAHEVS